MGFGREKRKFIADNSSKVALYVLSIIILVSIIAEKVNLKIVIGGGIAFILFMTIAIILLPNES